MNGDAAPSLISLRPRSETLIISEDCSVFITGRDGFVQAKSTDGLFVHRCRVVSTYRYLMNGEPFKPITLSSINQNLWFGYYIQNAGSDRDAVTANTLELKASRRLSQHFSDELTLTNFSQYSFAFEFALEIDADFADQNELAGTNRKQNGTIHKRWNKNSDESYTLVFDYAATHDYDQQGEAGLARCHRGVEIEIKVGGFGINYTGGAFRLNITLAPLESTVITIRAQSLYYGDHNRGPFENVGANKATPSLGSDQAFGLTTIATSDSLSSRKASALDTISRATSDLTALRLRGLDTPGGWTPAAGIPIYLGFFGRDVLFTGVNAVMLGPELLQGSLENLASWQSTGTNDWRDEQPGRMLHQAEIGPLAVLNYTPFRRYYGTITTPAVFGWALGKLWRWTGNRHAVARFIEAALKALHWLDQYCTSGCDGFYGYRKRSSGGLKNQAWKDSGGAIVYESGAEVADPIATCECQAYVYASKLHTAELLAHLGRADEGRKLFKQAEELKKRFNDAFWMPDLKFIAIGLDKDGRQIKSISSNPLHCLETGILDDGFVRQVVDRLFEMDLYSGWGVRTLSADHVAYNPYSYQRGSVWPFEQGALALGLRRYRLYDQLDRLVRDQFELAELFEHNRLPELLGGQARDLEHPFPSMYSEANWPQAWSAAAIFAHIEALLGLQPDASAHRLIVDPHLPEYLPELRLQNLRVGDASVNLTFHRRGDGHTDAAIGNVSGNLKIRTLNR